MKESKSKAQGQKKQTPLMQQYFAMKAEHPDAIMLFRVGDFYETFGEDAVLASKILGIILTARNNGSSKIELAGFPHHSLDVYLPKLVRSGHRVAICEQLEKPSKEKKIVKRGVTELVTPGLTADDKILDHRSNNYLAAVHFLHPAILGLALLDLSTGEFYVTEGDEYVIEKLLRSFMPTEVLVARSRVSRFQSLFGDSYYCYGLEDWVWTEELGPEKLRSHFEVHKLKGFGIEDLGMAQVAAGAILQYLEMTQNRQLRHIHQLRRLEPGKSVWLDRFTIRNLELIDSMHDNGKSLAEILDHSSTSMGSRLLKKWILFPLLDRDEIDRRLEVVDRLVSQIHISTELRTLLKGIGDLERLISKVSLRKANPRELLHILHSLETIPDICASLAELELPTKHLLEDLRDCAAVTDIIATSISPDAPIALTKGGVIATGYHEQLDEYRDLVRNSKDLLVDIQTVEAKKTGITSLKIGFNNVFGYYLEVTNKYKDKGLIPDHWVRKQTLTNAERYITDELKVLEQKILTAQDQISSLEEKLYSEVLEHLSTHIAEVQHNAEILARLDVLLAFALVAVERQYCRPAITDGLDIHITAGRHPVIELQLGDTERYIPNDLKMDPDENQIFMITGPNMSGKSALLRQTALICLMAQMGSFVPADAAEIGVIDKIFTRVGASDNISSGESTFMVEMSETASIMNNMSPRSLILLDEIGRGTSTYDGISIAWSIAEFLHTHKSCHPKTLFATHYHEMNQLADMYERIVNYHVATQESGSKVVFLRKLVEGGSEHSFGIHVARMAGMPSWIIKRAYEMLQELESHRVEGAHKTISATKASTPVSSQMNLFDQLADPLAEEIKRSLEELDINQLTPIDALMKLHQLQQKLYEK